MIGSFKDEQAKRIFDGLNSRMDSGLERIIERKLRAVEAAVDVHDLTVPPGNRLEALKGNRKGQHSIRINQQFRICFRWEEHRAWEIEIVDYH